MKIDPKYIRTLQLICERLENSNLNWVLTGSLGMAVQGLDVEIHDIDIQTDEAGAYAFEDLFSEYVVTPVRYLVSERIRSYLGHLRIEGVEIDVMGDVQKLLEDGGWEEVVRVEDHQQWIEFAGLRVPVFSLEYEYQAYLRMGRVEKAGKIKEWLDREG